MALAEHEAIAIGRVERRQAQHLAVERGDDVGDRERGADVPHPGALRLLNHDPPYC
jgi:hypothetical protein